MTVLVVYPDAGTGNTTVDGFLGKNDETTWSANRDAALGSSVSDTGTTIAVRGSKNSPTNWNVQRGIMTFDTSSTGASISISSAILSGYGNFVNDTDSSSVSIVSASPAADNALALGDFDSLGGTAYSSITLASFSASAYNDFTLDANGIDNVNSGGISRFGIRNSRDLSDSEPTGDNASNIVAADTAGTTQDPKLTVTYTEPVPPTVTTQACTDVTSTTATGNGNITAEGDATPTTRGFVFLVGTTGDPTTADNVVSETGTFSTGSFSLALTGLTQSAAHRVAAFSTSTEGTAYGATVDLQLDGTLHPAGNYHNGAESKILQSETNAALIATDAVAQDFWYDGAGNAVARGHDDIDYNFDDEGTAHNTTLANATENAKNKITTYDSARTADEVDEFHAWAGNGTLLIDVNGATLLDVDGNPLFGA